MTSRALLTNRKGKVKPLSLRSKLTKRMRKIRRIREKEIIIRNLDPLHEIVEDISTHDNTKHLHSNKIPTYSKLPGMELGVMLKTYPNGKSETVRVDMENMNETILS